MQLRVSCSLAQEVFHENQSVLCLRSHRDHSDHRRHRFVHRHAVLRLVESAGPVGFHGIATPVLFGHHESREGQHANAQDNAY